MSFISRVLVSRTAEEGRHCTGLCINLAAGSSLGEDGGEPGLVVLETLSLETSLASSILTPLLLREMENWRVRTVH